MTYVTNGQADEWRKDAKSDLARWNLPISLQSERVILLLDERERLVEALKASRQQEAARIYEYGKALERAEKAEAAVARVRNLAGEWGYLAGTLMDTLEDAEDR